MPCFCPDARCGHLVCLVAAYPHLRCGRDAHGSNLHWLYAVGYRAAARCRARFCRALLSVGVCASLWVSDSFAYIVGSRIGKHKMVPKISPKKSWEGFAGGILGSVLIWLILWATHFYKLSLPYALLCGVVVSVLGVIGDLIESRIKRGVGVKDSGNLIPGHGGMLDRSDSLIFGCITAQLLLMIGGVL